MSGAKSVSHLFLLFALCLPAYIPTLAQTAAATLSGTVTDERDALVPGATVTATNPATGLRRQVTTGDDGTFTIPLLPPATYTILVEQQGFATAKLDGVVLNVNDNRSLNIQLRLGQISGDTVTIDANANTVQESPEVATTVDRQFVANLPLNGRSFQSLIVLSPGVVLARTSATSQGQFSVNGQRTNANYFTVDGVSANIGIAPDNNLGQFTGGSLPGFAVTGGTNNLVSVDALQEFKIQTSTYAPEFGRTPGAQVQLITRGGTNEFRGTVFEYFRNDALDANDWFANSRGLERPPLRQNDFGGTLGGPIFKNRTFFFFSYEGLRLRLPQTRLAMVPSVSVRENAPAAIRPLLNAFPIPNGRELGNGLAEFNASYSDPSTLNATSVRVDQAIGGKFTLFGRYNDAPSSSLRRSAALTGTGSVQQNTRTLTLGPTWVITSGVSNEFRFNYSRTEGKNSTEASDFGGAVPPTSSLLFPPSVTPENGLFFLNIIGVGALLIGNTADNFQSQINVIDNLSVVSGRHQVKLGIDYRRLAPTIAPVAYQQSVIFRGIGLTTPGVPPPGGSILSGRALLAQVSAQEASRPVFKNFSAYGQDTWKATPRLTLTYGVRWELNPPPSSRSGRNPFVLTQVDDPATFSLTPEGTPLYETAYHNFAPRAGAAFLLSKRQGRETVLRGGAGVFYDLGTGPAANGYGNSAPFTATKSFFVPGGIPFPLTPAQAAPPPLPPLPPFGVKAFDPKIKLPRTYQWNLTLEQSLGPEQVLSTAYLGAAGRHLLRTEFITVNSPDIFNVMLTKDDASSDYHALQVHFRRRLSRGLQALTSYTWSKSIDTVSDDLNVTDPG